LSKMSDILSAASTVCEVHHQATAITPTTKPGDEKHEIPRMLQNAHSLKTIVFSYSYFN
jgi:hypothetical protein